MAICLVLPLVVFGAPPKIEDFDVAPKDGKITFNEFVKFQIAARDPKLSEIDADNDLILSEDELHQFADIDWAAIVQAGNTTVPVTFKEQVTFVQAASTVPPPKSDAWGVNLGNSVAIRLGKDHDSLLKPLDKSDPASVGFFHNNLSGEDTWAIEAALGAQIHLVDREHPPTIGKYLVESIDLVPSASLNKITGTGDGTKQVADALVFRGGFGMELESTDFSATLWDRQFFSASYRSTGSTRGGDFKSAGEFDWEPSRSREGDWISINGPFHPPFDNHDIPFDYRFVYSAHLEFGETAKPLDDAFVKAGPKIGIRVIPGFAPRLTLFADYTYLWEATGDSDDFDYLETGFRWTLDDNKQVFLEGKYRYGQLPAKYTDIDVFQLSLSVKF